jgi:hypothetical protein
MRKYIAALMLSASLSAGLTVAESSQPVADAVPVLETADRVEARLTNCGAWKSGGQFYASCSGVNTFLAPYGNQVVAVADCVRPWYYGGGSYQAVGDWVGRNHTSIGNCATFYNATNARYWLR